MWGRRRTFRSGCDLIFRIKNHAIRTQKLLEKVVDLEWVEVGVI